jgi:hypothetical protein
MSSANWSKNVEPIRLATTNQNSDIRHVRRTRSIWLLIALITMPGIALAGLSDAPRKSAFAKALNVILAKAAPRKSEIARATIIRNYEDAKANKGEAIEPISGETWRSSGHEDPAVVGDRTLEGCQLRFGKPCSLLAVNEEIIADGELISKDMPKMHFSGTYDPQEIPIIKSTVRESSEVQDYGRLTEQKAMAIHPWGRIFVSNGRATIKEAEQTALDECNSNQRTRFNARGGNCFLYASNNDVVISKRLMSPAGVAPPSCQIGSFKMRVGETNTANWAITNGGFCVARFKLAATSHFNSVTISSRPAHGIAEADGVAGVTYRPDQGFKGEDSFAFSVEGYFKGKKEKPGDGTGVVRVFIRVE